MNIRELRELTGQTQKQFSESLGIPVGTLRRWEYGESTPAPYLLRLIAQRLPDNNKNLTKIESPRGTYYYDKSANTIIDSKGTRIPVGKGIDGVNESNLVLYANSLFEAYYDAVERFDRSCELDKEENILWG